MSQPELFCSPDPVRGGSPAPRATDLVAAEARARSEAWTATATADPGDIHEKGEISLCVGEGA